MNLFKRFLAGNSGLKLYVSRKPEKIGGGSNSFTHLFIQYAEARGHRIVSRMHKANKAIVIAHLAEMKDVQRAKENGCTIIHRLDEDFAYLEGQNRSEKHQKIIQLNKLADITVFQSQFVFDNIYPYIKPQKYKIILNGSDPSVFRPAPVEEKKYIGHVSWSLGDKKRFDLLHKFILENPQEKFLLVGRHKDSALDFNLPNVTLAGPVNRKNIASVFDQMKILYFPSERDPCPNTVVESILSGVPVCYNPIGGTIELVKDCGLPLTEVKSLLENLDTYRARCRERQDLHFEKVLDQYLND